MRSRIDVLVEILQGVIDLSAKIALIAVTVPAPVGNLVLVVPLQLFFRDEAMWITAPDSIADGIAIDVGSAGTRSGL